MHFSSTKPDKKREIHLPFTILHMRDFCNIKHYFIKKIWNIF